MIKQFMWPYKKRIFINAFIKISATIAEIFLPALLAMMIDEIAPTKNTRMIYLVGMSMIVLSFLAWILNVAANRMATKTSSMAIETIRQQLFERTLNLSSGQIDNLTISSLEGRLTTDTYMIHRFFGAMLRMGIRSILLFVGGVIFCIFLSWQLSLILIGLVIPLLLVIRLTFNKARSLFRDVQHKNDEMVQVIRENIAGIRVIKALNKVEYERKHFEIANDAFKEAQIKADIHMAKLMPIVNGILYTGLAAVIILGGLLVQRGIIHAGVILAFMTYFFQITNSLLSMNRMFNMYSRYITSSQRIMEVLSLDLDTNQQYLEPIITQLPKANPNVPEIEFKDVSFSYLKEKDNLQHISFKLYPEQTLGIMGATGSGKSSILKVLLRQYEIDSGQILIRGIDIRQIDPSALKSLFGVVFQNDFLYRGTLRENINFGRRKLDDEIEKATEMAQARAFIEEKDEGLDLKLASKGVNLSGGQKQRVLIARALLANPSIILLDDSSSALDFKTESLLRKELEQLSSTMMIIAQRISSIIQADQILFLQDGQVVGQGTHQELLEQSSNYRKIASVQLGGEYHE